jgi:PIN domain nuclease of toxin-antitoxin system
MSFRPGGPNRFSALENISRSRGRSRPTPFPRPNGRASIECLLDTAVWINGVTLPSSLPLRIRRLLEDTDRKTLCSVSLLETAILHRLGRLAFEGALDDFVRAGLSGDLQLLDLLTPVIAAKTKAPPRHSHGDPFDRTIAATASTLDLTLITMDAAIRNAEVCAVEYYPFKASRPRHP